MTHRPHFPARRLSAFTLIELLVVVGIIGVLIAILVPTISKIRISAQAASTKNFIGQLIGSIERYGQDFSGACPGPLTNRAIFTTNYAVEMAPFTAFAGVTNPAKLTQAENLVLGLLGGLRPVAGTPLTLQYDPTLLGGGPMSLNPVNPKRYSPYGDKQNLSSGHFVDGSGAADDTEIPEFVDSFSSPMPILVLRAQKGAGGRVGSGVRTTQYDTDDIASYLVATPGAIGEGKTLKVSKYVNFTPAPTAGLLPHGLGQIGPTDTLDKNGGTNYKYPYSATPYFTSPSDSTAPRNKDGYILISAGPDRVYGTEDDITNFGSVLP